MLPAIVKWTALGRVAPDPAASFSPQWDWVMTMKPTFLRRRWLAFHAEHRAAQGISGADIDPSEFVRENS